MGYYITIILCSGQSDSIQQKKKENVELNLEFFQENCEGIEFCSRRIHLHGT